MRRISLKTMFLNIVLFYRFSTLLTILKFDIDHALLGFTLKDKRRFFMEI